MRQSELRLQFTGLPPLSLDEREAIRMQINREHKGMANRANYQDMNQAIGLALRKLDISDEDKRQFAVDVSGRLHYPRPATRDMSVDHICSLAGAYIKR